MQNIETWTAALWITAPAMEMKAVMAMPHLRPNLSEMGPAMGMARTEPTKTMATLSATKVVFRLKYSV